MKMKNSQDGQSHMDGKPQPAGLGRRLKTLHTMTCALLLGAAPGPLVWAQSAADYPNRPIRIIVPQSPGSAADTLARVMAPRLSEALGQALVIDNRAGAGGLMGADAAAKAQPDGYTVLLGASAWITIAPHTYKKVTYDAIQDFAPVSLFAIGQSLLVVNPSLPIHNLPDWVAWMKTRPQQSHMASAGLGSASHFAGLLLTTMTGTSATHVPYKGAGPSVLSVITGESDWTFTPMQGPLAQARAGKLRAIAVGGSARSLSLPDVPTVAESGYPDFFAGTWYGLMVPKGTPAAVIDKLNAAVQRVVALPEVKESIVHQGAEPKATSAAEMGKFVRAEYERAGRMVRLAGVTAE